MICNREDYVFRFSHTKQLGGIRVASPVMTRLEAADVGSMFTGLEVLLEPLCKQSLPPKVKVSSKEVGNVHVIPEDNGGDGLLVGLGGQLVKQTGFQLHLPPTRPFLEPDDLEIAGHAVHAHGWWLGTY